MITPIQRNPPAAPVSASPAPPVDPNADPNVAQPGTNRVWGGATNATIDQANQAMRVMPWYQDLLHSWGMTTAPGQAPTLNKSQQTQVLRAAQAHGFQVDEGNLHVDEHGNFHNNGHALRNTLIVAGLAAATIATMGAAGAFSGAAGAAMAGGEAAAGGAAAAGGVTAGTLAGIEGGTAGLTAAGAAGLGAATAVPALAGAGAAGAVGAAGAAGAAGGSILPTAGTVAGTAGSVLPKAIGSGGDSGFSPYDPTANAGGTGPNGTIQGTGIDSSPSILQQAGQYGRSIAPVLGAAARTSAQGQQQNFQNNAGLAEAALAEPGTHLKNILAANAAANGPAKANWGGPGSGLRGETVTYSGGRFAPLSPDLQSQLQPFEQTEMQKLLHPTLDPASNPNLQPNGSNSAWDKILGGGAMAASILGSGGRF